MVADWSVRQKGLGITASTFYIYVMHLICNYLNKIEDTDSGGPVWNCSVNRQYSKTILAMKQTTATCLVINRHGFCGSEEMKNITFRKEEQWTPINIINESHTHPKAHIHTHCKGALFLPLFLLHIITYMNTYGC